MSSGLTNYGKTALLTGVGWNGDGPLQCELLTEVYDELQLQTLENRTDLAVPTGGTYTPLGAPPWGIAGPVGSLLDFTDDTGSGLAWINLDTGGQTVRGYALCSDNKVLLVHQIPAYVPNGDNFTIVLNSSIVFRTIVVGDPSVSFLTQGVTSSPGFNPLEVPISAYLVTVESLSPLLEDWTYDGENVRSLSSLTLTVTGGEVALTSEIPLTWDNYLPENPAPVLGVLFAYGATTIAYAKFEEGIVPDGSPLTYTLDHLLCLK